MPNGGSDCCGTCWFNIVNINKKKAYKAEARQEKELPKAKCLIRDLDIPDPFWTYCANHPHHTHPKKIKVPIGPVYVNDGYPYTRKVWMKPPDTEEIRMELIKILSTINTKIETKAPVPLNLDIEAVLQIVVLKEKRAIPELLRIANLKVEMYRESPGRMFFNKAVTVGLAAEAILEIAGCKYLDKLEQLITKGLETYSEETYKEKKDNLGVIRYHLVRGLAFCNSKKSYDLLKQAENDPHREIRAFASEILSKRL